MECNTLGTAPCTDNNTAIVNSKLFLYIRMPPFAFSPNHAKRACLAFCVFHHLQFLILLKMQKINKTIYIYKEQKNMRTFHEDNLYLFFGIDGFRPFVRGIWQIHLN
eukprot:GEMP01118729.1.p1 GENE.GEMP01118729.1~~GEMP01118729.1.p1  ORF type:complete len:107 (-),score=2.28 GEMP01118729.1:92-412(-)